MLIRFNARSWSRNSIEDQELINALLKVHRASGTAALNTAGFLHMREPDLNVTLDADVADLLAAIRLIDLAPADDVAALRQQLVVRRSPSIEPKSHKSIPRITN